MENIKSKAIKLQALRVLYQNLSLKVPNETQW